jgi:hypothetical protein
MPTVHYYLGRPAHVWIAAMSRRSPAPIRRPQTCKDSIPARPGPPRTEQDL